MQKRLASREFNLSYAEIMQEDNKLTSGSWWTEDSKQSNSNNNYFSVEEGIAETLGINIGDELTYSIAGQEVHGNVTNSVGRVGFIQRQFFECLILKH